MDQTYLKKTLSLSLDVALQFCILHLRIFCAKKTNPTGTNIEMKPKSMLIDANRFATECCVCACLCAAKRTYIGQWRSNGFNSVQLIYSNIL